MPRSVKSGLAVRFIVAVVSSLLFKYLSNDPFASNLHVLDPPPSLPLIFCHPAVSFES